MKLKSRDSRIMVSNFINDHNGFLALTDEKYEQAKKANTRAKKYARQIFFNMERTRRATGHVTSSLLKLRMLW